MASPLIKMLLIEDDRVDRMAFERSVQKQALPYDVSWAGSVDDGRKALRSNRFDIVIMDYMLGDGAAFDLFGEVPEGVPIVVVTGGADAEIAVQAMKLGAADYLIKDREGHYLKTLPVTVANAIKAKEAEKALRRAHDELEQRVRERTAELVEINEKLRLEISERKRAESSLAEELTKFHALYGLALAMAGEHSLDENLRLLVEQSGKLLSTDTAYLAIRDEARGELYIHTHCGLRTSAMAGLRAPLDLGLSAHAAKTGQGVIQEDFFLGADPLFHDALRKEGLVSGVMVPVQVGRTNLGVLYASNRTKTVFPKSALDTLALLGNLAAVEITRDRAEQALRRSEQRYRTLVDNIDIGVTLIDAYFNIVMTNSARARMLRRDAASLVGSKCFTEFRGLDSICSDCPGVQAVASGTPAEMETKGSGYADGAAHLRVRAFPLFGPDGAAVGHIEVVEDVTRRRGLEEQLRHTAKMEAIGLLAGGVAHDFNNLLTAIIGYSDMLLEQIPDREPYYKRVVQVGRAAQRAARLTRQLLAFSRKQVLDMKVIDLNASIANFEKLLRRLMGVNVELHSELSPTPATVYADAGQIEQILMNLAVNARDAMPEGGHLSIKTTTGTLDEADLRAHEGLKAGKCVILSVTDTGTGMDSQTMSRIFDPFFTTKERGRGTGLGLATVYGIVTQHQGHVSVKSEPGMGTTFRIYLPLVEETPEDAAQARAETAPKMLGNETILLVEDDEVVRQVTREILERLGYITLVSGDPLEAMTLSDLHQGRIHLLLSDVALPKMDGAALFSKLSQTRPELKALYMSGHAENSVLRDWRRAPGFHFLEKPFTMERLASKVREVLDNAVET